MGTEVLLNIYDLSPANDYLYNVGLGVHHSGVEILGLEYSFASGAGIFTSAPKEVPGARYRETIRMGTFEGGAPEVRMVVAELRSFFAPESYNLILKNCNHFAESFCKELLGKSIPGYVNRLADLGGCVKCLIPRQMLEAAPVGHESGNNLDAGFHVHKSSSSGATTGVKSSQMFSGRGNTLGSSSDDNVEHGDKGSGHFSSLGALKMRTNSKPSLEEDINLKRERSRKAALARFERTDSVVPEELKSS